MIENIKCLVWDLDNTIWSGTLIEADSCRLKYGIKSILSQLDSRGILLSIASANDQDMAVSILRKKRLLHYFLCPQIGWSNKVSSIKKISKILDIPMNVLGFIDNEPYEIEQVKHLLPLVRTYSANEYIDLLKRDEFKPQFRTKESSMRRSMYMHSSYREKAQKQLGCSRKAFLKICNTQINIRDAVESDLPRLLELMRRTHQLNSTGTVYNENQICSFISDDEYHIYVAELRDRFVDYGRIGVAIVHCTDSKFEIISFLLSCRILGRGIGHFFLTWLQVKAFKLGYSKINSHFVKRDRNHRMRMLYQFAGFEQDKTNKNDSIVFTKKTAQKLKIPEWLVLNKGMEV